MSEHEALPAGLPRLISDRYEIESLIGRGGMADVYLATDHVLARKVAVKLLRQDTASNPMVVNRFRREAKSVAGLSHPNIVAVYDTGELPASGYSSDNLPYMVMEYVTGRTLKQVLAQEQLDPGYAVDLIQGVCDALDHSHLKQVVHRDIKPANVMVTDDGHVKLMDFGIARALDASATMTQTSAVVGTAQYFSPEQARGEQVDFRSDIYSAGCLFYELLTGRPPFTGDSPVSVAYQHVGEDPVPPSKMPGSVDPVYDSAVLKALSKDRETRFQSAGDFAAALQDARNGISYQEPADPHAPAYTVPLYAAGQQQEAPQEQHYSPATSEHPVFAPAHAPAPVAVRHKSNRAVVTWLAIIAVLAVAVAGFLAFRFFQAQAEERAPVPVPSGLAGLSEEDAANKLRDATFNVDVEHEFSDDVEEGLVTRTDPDAGTELRKSSTVRLYISDGTEQRTIPEDLASKSEASARDMLEKAGLEVGEVTREDSATVPADWVIGTSPELGSKVKAGTKIDLVLSTGEVKVPEVTGLSREEAEAKLEAEDVGLQAQFLTVQTGDYPEGTLYAQDPVAGEQVAQGSLVKIMVAQAPPAPDPEPEPSDEPDDEPSQEPSQSQSPSQSGNEDASAEDDSEDSGN